ncbi:MAG: type II toxin-antitoxin system HicB family antitoxin [Nitrospirae bacterium]|jgi:predicted HicB family RNase H-like nuclease|nr:type II toxin-antitoxin system HicB family antitoxin [Nitrospirota bacterium]
MNSMSYNGYTARIEYDNEDHIFTGRIAGIRDVIGFHGSSVDELEQAFRESVDDYLDACNKIGQSPNKPASGRLMLRVPPEVHSAALVAAQVSGQSLNQWAMETIQKAAQHPHQ